MVNAQVDTVELRSKALKGVGWSVGAKFFRQFIQLLFQILLARLLSPEDFGLFSMVLVFSALADILRNMGLGAAIIQRTGVEPAHLDTVFWTNLLSGLIIFLLFQLAAPLIAVFYKTPALENITRVYAVIFLIGSLNVVQEAVMHKQLQFKRLFLIEASAVLSGGVVALVMASYNYGVWTLVGQYLCISIVSTIVLWLTSSWRPVPRFSIRSLHELRKFGSNLVAHDLLSFLSRNIDNLFIGRVLGAAALGIYSRAYFLMLQPVNITNQVLARVMFPVFSKMQHDHGYIQKTYLKSTRLVAFFVFPCIVYVFVLAVPLIRILLGNQWLEVAFILQVFCIYSLVDTIGNTTAWIYKSLGRTDIMFRWSIYSTAVIIGSIIVGLNWGIEGVAMSYTAAFLVLLWLPGWYFAFRLIDLKVGAMLVNLAPVFITSALTGGFMALAKYLLQDHLQIWTLCLLVLMTGIAFYLVTASLLDSTSFKFLRSLLTGAFKRVLSGVSKSASR